MATSQEGSGRNVGTKRHLQGWEVAMKRILLAILISIFSWTAAGATPFVSISDDRKKDEKQRKKDPPGPPVVKDKGRDDRPKDPPPKRGKRPD